MSRKQRKKLIMILLGAALLPIAYLLPFEGWMRILAFLVPYGIVGFEVLWAAARNIRNGQIFDEQFLMTIATVGAFLVGEYPEAVLVMLFYQIGELFQSIAVGKSRKSISDLMNICPDYACVLREGKESEVFPEEVEIGETILIRPGEKIPLDGVIFSGRTMVDTAALTGESCPIDCAEGDRVISGSVNLSGAIEVQVSKRYEESTVSKILELVENSAVKKSKAERFITRFARYYTPFVVVSAALLAVVPSLVTGQWSVWVHRALIFLVVSCPCALVISVPLSFFGGIGGASKRGILIKGANYLESLSKVQTMVFDKTGTLTKGSFEVTAVCGVSMEEEQLLEFAALAESRSNHPIAQSICNYCKKDLDLSLIRSVQEIPGKGILAAIGEAEVAIGTKAHLTAQGIDVMDASAVGTVIYLAVNRNYAGYIVVADRPKDGAKKDLQKLRSAGVHRLVMMTGDRLEVGEAIGAELGLDQVHAQLLPDQKVSCLETLLAKKEGNVAFVGDGINDAPVLTRADVGIAMGALGSDAAIEAADIVLMDDQLSKLSEAIRLSRKTMGIVWQNIIFSLGVKGAVLLLSALGLAGMGAAIFADVGVMVLAILNAMRTLKGINQNGN